MHRASVWRLLWPWLIITLLLLVYRFLQRYFVNPEEAFKKIISVGVLFSSAIWLLLLPAVYQVFRRLEQKPLRVLLGVHLVSAVVIGLIQSYLFIYLHKLIWPGAIDLSLALSPVYILADLRLNFFIYIFFVAALYVQRSFNRGRSVNEQSGNAFSNNQEAPAFSFPLKHIVMVEAMGNYVAIWEASGEGLKRHVQRGSMSSMEARLSTEDFLRVQKSFIVNRRFVKSRKRGAHGEYILELNSGKRVSTSRNLKKEIHTWLCSTEPYA